VTNYVSVGWSAAACKRVKGRRRRDNTSGPVDEDRHQPQHDADADQAAAMVYWTGSRPVHGPAKNAQASAPRTGRNVGVRKCS
jgi:hypothetical protein